MKNNHPDPHPSPHPDPPHAEVDDKLHVTYWKRLKPWLFGFGSLLPGIILCFAGITLARSGAEGAGTAIFYVLFLVVASAILIFWVFYFIDFRRRRPLLFRSYLWKFLVGGFGPLVLAGLVWGVSTLTPSGTQSRLYRKVQKFGAEEAYEQYAQKYPNHENDLARLEDHLGNHYYDESAGKNYAKAARYWERMLQRDCYHTDNNSVTTRVNLGKIYFNGGHGVEPNYSKAINVLKPIAPMGDDDTQLLLGTAYYRRREAADDVTKAIEWYEKAAAQGNTTAMGNLGAVYLNGAEDAELQQEELAKSFEWHRKATERGYVPSMNRLGWFYSNGVHVDENHTEAMAWFQVAAARNDADALYNLGLMYEIGKGVTADRERAISYYRKAAEMGQENAKSALEQVEKGGQWANRTATQEVRPNHAPSATATTYASAPSEPAASSRTAAARTSTTDPGVVINGIVWATRNVDAPGIFAPGPESPGGVFTTIDEAMNACPTGCRLPTSEEAESLFKGSSKATVNGREFASGNSKLFLPTTQRGQDGTIEEGVDGAYWLYDGSDDGFMRLRFNDSPIESHCYLLVWGNAGSSFKNAVRCVAI